ncbi:MAG TPA: HEAT repeat domain-containing protein [Candidatus Eisenbacteria bacterium]
MKLVDHLQAGRHIAALRSHPHPSDPRRIRARRQLIALGPGAVPPLLGALKSLDVRAAAGEILFELLDDRTLPFFLEALANPEPATARVVLDILTRNQGYDPTQLLDLFADSSVPKSRVEALLVAQMPRIQPRLLVTLIPEMSREARALTFRLLDRHADAAAVLESIRLADDPDWWIRFQMARLLARVAHPDGATVLIRLLADENRGVRLEATRSLGRLRDPRAVPALCRTLRDADLRVQTGAIDALIGIGHASAVPHLVEVLMDESETARRAAVEVLNEVATADAIKDLVMALRDADWWVRSRAADALGTLGGPPVVDAVLAILDDPDEQVRRYAVEILNVATDTRAVEPLIRALDDTDWWVRERAIDALARTRDSRAVEPLAAQLFRDADAAALCVSALRRIGHPSALPIFERLIDSESAELRRGAIEGLLELFTGELSADERRRVVALLADVGVDPTRRGSPIQESRPTVARTPGNSSGERPASATGEMPAAPVTPSNAPVTPANATPRIAPDSPSLPAAPRVFRDVTQLPPGEVLVDRYRVVRKVGGGGFGTVYLVEDVLIRDELVLKVLNPQLTHDATMTRRFLQEMRVSRRITHPNVIRTHELVDLGGWHAIAMEYFPSRDLGDVLKSEGRMSPERALAIGIQVCEALAAAHERGTIHRDVKPGNILIDENDQVKVVDFGLAAIGQRSGSRLTMSGTLLGTPEYMAPEQITDGSADARSDIYSLGAVLYEMLSGVSPFAGENTAHVLFQHIEGDIRPISEAAPGLPEGLDAVVMSMLARAQADRPDTANGLAERLRAIRAVQGGADGAGRVAAA